MKHIITENEISKITGRWIVQLNNYQENIDITTSENSGFWLEKRISFVGRLYGSDGLPNVEVPKGEEFIILNGIYYTHGIKTPKEFVEFFNNYVNGERFHRLLTNKELDWLNEQLKSRNY